MESLPNNISITSEPPKIEQIWVGECKVCKKITAKTCKRCEVEFFCCRKHHNEQKKQHKEICEKTLKIKQDWKKKKVLDLEKDIFKIAAEVFSEKYISHDQKLGTWCMLPVGNILNLNGRKGYKMKIFGAEDPKITLEEYKKKGFTKEIFYEIYSQSKAPLYHNALILALRELCVLYNAEITFSGSL